jgi:hypothetical protein
MDWRKCKVLTGISLACPKAVSMGEKAVGVPSMNSIIHPNFFLNTVPRTVSSLGKPY